VAITKNSHSLCFNPQPTAPQDMKKGVANSKTVATARNATHKTPRKQVRVVRLRDLLRHLSDRRLEKLSKK